MKNIKNKKRLNIIKYNKIIKSKLDINKEDYEIYIILKEYNDKYKTNIDDIDIKELNFSETYIGKTGLKDLVKIKFKALKELDLSDNKISDIKILEKVDFKDLQQLDLSKNAISDIKVLERVNFKLLQQLDLNKNRI